MQVTHIQDSITHAVIGGNKAIDFEVDNSPELMHVLSTVLYSNQKLAVIRETLCNAWDAHIEAGKTGTPVEVTLTPEKLVIRDYGSGIPKAMIGPVYGRYGGSTKKANGAVTGGFGLGCKVPFAYTDHFETISWCEGEKTIYNMSKSNAEVGGRPSIMPIMSIPTTETGLQVSIKLKNKTDWNDFDGLIRRIVSNGGMNVILNNEQLKTMPFDQMKHNFLMTSETVNDDASKRILVRYGHVIYPIDQHDDYNEQFMKIINFLGRLPGNNEYYFSGSQKYRLILQAKPHSLAVTPSREALSMQAHTINSIKELLEEFIELSDKNIKTECFNILEKKIAEVRVPINLLTNLNEVPGLKKEDGKTFLIDFPEFIGEYMRRNYPNYKGFQKKDHNLRLKYLIEGNFGRRGLLQTFRHEFWKKYKKTSYEGVCKRKNSADAWFHRRIVYPLIKGMEAYPTMSKEKLFALDTKLDTRTYTREIGFNPIMGFTRENLEAYIPYLRNIIVLAHTRVDMEIRLRQFPVFKNWMGNPQGTLVYMVPRNTNKIEEAQKFFKEQGFFIVDLTKAQKWEDKEIHLPAPKLVNAKPKIKKIGLVMLSEMRVPNGGLSSDRLFKDDAKRIELPEFVIKDGRKNEAHHIEPFEATTSGYIVDLIGDKGGIVSNSNQEAKFCALGSKTFVEYLTNYIYEKIKNSKTIQEAYASSFRRVPHNYDSGFDTARKAFEAIELDKDLFDYFGLVDNRTEDEKKIMAIWDDMSSKYIPNMGNKSQPIIEELKKIPLNTNVIALFRTFQSNKMLSMLKLSDFKIALYDKYYYTQNQRNLVRDTLLEFLEG